MTARMGLALFLGLPIAVLAAVVALAPYGREHENADLPGERVVARVPSPDGRRIATVTAIKEVQGYLVRVDDQDAFLASGAERLSVRWLDPNVLKVVFGHARNVRKGQIAGLRLVVEGVVRSAGKGSKDPARPRAGP